MASQRLLIGVDVGDVATGIEEAIRTLLKQADVYPSNVASLMIGTTHFINAVVEHDASRLEPVAVLRLAAGDYMKNTPPFIDFPPALTKIQIDGTEIGLIKEADILEQAKIIKAKGLQRVAVVGIYSTFDEKYTQEYQIVCSRDVAGVGILARENAAILNASILRFAKRAINSFKRAMKRLDLKCPLYLTSNSGQLLSSDEATLFPIQIFASGATNSIRGASFLSSAGKNTESRYVVDIGGTTTDIGCLLPSGFPRLASSSTDIGGVRVNFAIPQIESIGLGGGSLVHVPEGADGRFRIGPDSVGQALREKAKCFGGGSLTATDVMVAAGVAKAGTSKPVVLLKTMEAVRKKMKTMIEDLIDRMKTSPEPCSLLLVGGGAFLCPPELVGVATIEIPEHSGAANAVGAAVAEIGEAAELIVDNDQQDTTLVEVKARAIAAAVARDAKEDEVRIIEEDVSGIPYIEVKSKIVVKVVGPVDYARFLNSSEIDVPESSTDEMYDEMKKWEIEDLKTFTEADIDHDTYRPNVDCNRVWHLTETDAYYISIGCYILGCAGGGTPYGSYLELRQILREGGDITIIDIEDLEDGALCGPVAAMGSPAIAIERLGGNMIGEAWEGLQKHLGIKFSGVIAAEIGGSNGFAPLHMSNAYSIPCVDADVMGRAFPAFEMSSLYIGAGDGNINHLLPVCLASGDGTTMTFSTSKDALAVDKVLLISLAAGIAARPCTKTELQNFSIPKSQSLAWRLGRAVVRARSKETIGSVHRDLITEFGGPQAAKKIFEGKIVGVGSTIYKGHSYGKLIIDKLKDYEKESESSESHDTGPQKIEIPFKNENLLVEAFYKNGEKKILTMVPDLIMVLDTLTGEACGVPEYRYGLKIMVMVAAAHPLWISKRGLEIAGPKAFGYDFDFMPCGAYTGVTSVIDEYAPKA
ncbi:hydantoinase [Rhexocercosporidium sp. MPI-PUGE-AT-0058]|nr:hydantoinase [Rhexocercosporidium sp. MPI-PUGE-AT-0058]